MGRSPCCDKVGLKKGPWTPEEDQKLLAYIEEHGHGSWRALPAKAGLQRCGKSCRLRWTNYLRPDIKRGKFSLQEEQTIIQLHALLGNRWSAIATHLPKRTDNEIKNYWNTHLKKRLSKMGIDPVTHKPKNDLLSNDGVQSKTAANLSHMAQWESARLEAEARLVRESKLRQSHHSNINSSSSSSLPILGLSSTTKNGGSSSNSTMMWSHVSWSKSTPVIDSPRTVIEFVGSSTTASVASASNSEAGGGAVKEEDDQQDWKGFRNNNNNNNEDNQGIDQNSLSFGATWMSHNHDNNNSGGINISLGIDVNNVADDEDQLGFTSLLLNSSDDRSLSEDGGGGGGGSENGRSGSDDHEDNENYWNSILNLVNSSPSDSPMF